SAGDAIEYMLAGATAVQVGTASFLSAGTMLKVVDGLRDYCETHHVGRIRNLTKAMVGPQEVRLEDALTV
ncbi:MAG TPA: dihydroorotate dehydrogenase, partial [Burkholderiaceae bacterium]|nr:dihydroorotate dehydrogenase [Burkholderiaceae bacterium]